MAGLGKKTFTAGDVLTASDVNGYLMDQSVMVFGGTAARSSAIPTPTEGMVTYLADTNALQVYDGAAYVGVASGMTLLSTTTLSGASTTVSSIPQTYANLEIWVYGMTNATGNSAPNFRPNSTINLIHAAGSMNENGVLNLTGINNSNIQTSNSGLRTDSNNAVRIRINNYASTTNYKNLDYIISMLNPSSLSLTEQYHGMIKTNSAITSFEFVNGGGNWSTGTVKIFGM